MVSLRDINSREFRIGQSVAVAERDSNIAILRTGVIEEIHEDEDKVSIRWTDGRVFGPKVSKIFVRGERIDRPRIVVIG